jgi:hypothetical protein
MKTSSLLVALLGMELFSLPSCSNLEANMVLSQVLG